MIEKIISGGILYSIIIRSGYSSNGIEFFTPSHFPQQLGYMNRPPGYVIAPHTHRITPRNVTSSQEVLLIVKGKVSVDFYDNDKRFISNAIVSSGDVLLLASGGHGFEMLESSEIIEVKQGPYEDDKIFIDPVT